jgi:hypothetical protein
MKLDDLTIGEAKKLAALFSPSTQSNGINDYALGEKVLVRTYSAGVWFGTLEQKSGNEVIVLNARRLWRWHAAESISLSAVAVYGVNQDKSSIAPAVEKIWLEAIEIIPCTDKAIKTIEGAKDAKAQ